MRRLFNEYEAFGVEAQFIVDAIDKAASEIVSKCLADDISLLDAQVIADGCLQADFAEARLRKAIEMKKAKRESAPVHVVKPWISWDDFKAAVGRAPVQDDLERSNCSKAGELGHEFCGWCATHNSPRFHCGCLVKKE